MGKHLKRADPEPIEPGASWHGSTYGYRKRGCRCGECREAQRVALADYYERNPGQKALQAERAKARRAEGHTGATLPPSERDPNQPHTRTEARKAAHTALTRAYSPER